jgi:hypothetical protein
MAYYLSDSARHGHGEGGLGRQDLVALGREVPDFEVDDSTLDARPSYVHPKAKHRHGKEFNGPASTGTGNLTRPA